METFDFYFGLKLGKLLFSHTDKSSQTLQSEKMSAVSSKHLAMLTVETISICVIRKVSTPSRIYA